MAEKKQIDYDALAKEHGALPKDYDALARENGAIENPFESGPWEKYQNKPPATLPADFFDKKSGKPPDTLPANFFDEQGPWTNYQHEAIDNPFEAPAGASSDAGPAVYPVVRGPAEVSISAPPKSG